MNLCDGIDGILMRDVALKQRSATTVNNKRKAHVAGSCGRCVPAGQTFPKMLSFFVFLLKLTHTAVIVDEVSLLPLRFNFSAHTQSDHGRNTETKKLSKFHFPHPPKVGATLK
jgi:hypothetical protein